MLAKQGLFAASSFNLSTIFTEPILIFQFYVAVAESLAVPLKVSSLLKSLIIYCVCAFILCGNSMWHIHMTNFFLQGLCGRITCPQTTQRQNTADLTIRILK